MNAKAGTLRPVRHAVLKRSVARGAGLLVLAQLAFWLLLSVSENLARPAGLSAPATVMLYLTKDWQLLGGEEPITVPLNADPLYDYKDTSKDPADNRGVFVTQFTAGETADGLAVFFSSTYSLKEVRLNGRLVKAQSPTDPQGSLSGFGPSAFVFPPEFVVPGENELTVLSSGRTYKALPLYFVGPAAEVLRAERWGRLFAFDLVVAATALMIFVAFFCVLVNWPETDKQRINALVILLLAWSLRNLSILGLFDVLPLPLLRIATYSANYLPLMAFVFFAVAWCDRARSLLKYRRLAYSSCVLVPVLLIVLDLRILPILGGVSIPWMIDNALTLVSMTFVILLFVKYFSTNRDAEGIETMLFVVCASAMLIDKLDNMFMLTVPFTDDLYLTFYAAPMCGLLLALGMCASIAAQATKARVAEATVKERLAEKLAKSEARIRQQARASARLEERRRIMQDMHDSLGSRLSVLVAEASDPEFPRAALVNDIVESIDELRLIVDSLDTEGDSLAMALGSYRSRIEPALRAAGIRLSWQVEAVESGEMSAEDVLEVFRILQAAFANVISHSGATEVTVLLQQSDGRLHLSVADNGRGLQDAAAEGKGLANMHARARRLGASLSVQSSQAGVRVQLSIPAKPGERSSE